MQKAYVTVMGAYRDGSISYKEAQFCLLQLALKSKKYRFIYFIIFATTCNCLIVFYTRCWLQTAMNLSVLSWNMRSCIHHIVFLITVGVVLWCVLLHAQVYQSDKQPAVQEMRGKQEESRYIRDVTVWSAEGQKQEWSLQASHFFILNFPDFSARVSYHTYISMLWTPPPSQSRRAQQEPLWTDIGLGTWRLGPTPHNLCWSEWAEGQIGLSKSPWWFLWLL